jgi:tRNA(adenine34) deaminase
MELTKKDKICMKVALKEAERALKIGDYPVGAVLVINDKIVAKKRNALFTETDWASHAELSIIKENSKLIKKHVKEKNSKVELFTTLEPCLMCLGASVLHRIDRIVYACPDPHGGATHIDPKNLTQWYEKKWPKIQGGLFKEEVYHIMIEFMNRKNDNTWKNIMKLYENMYKSWK